jgi:hypothetical protein
MQSPRALALYAPRQVRPQRVWQMFGFALKVSFQFSA